MEKDTQEMIYDISVDAYPFSISRIDAMNTRTQTILTIASTLAVACAVIATNLKGDGPTSHDFLLWISGIAFLKILITGWCTLLYGKLRALMPRMLEKDYLGKSPDQFRKEIISAAGSGTTHNYTVANHKHWLNTLALIFMGVQVITMGIWLIVS